MFYIYAAGFAIKALFIMAFSIPINLLAVNPRLALVIPEMQDNHR
jgi:hypothetical protein